MLGAFLEFIVSIGAALLLIGVLIFVIRLVLPGPDHWQKKWDKYSTTDAEQEKQDKHDRMDRWKKF